MVYDNILLSRSLRNAEIMYFDKYDVDSKLLMKNAANALLSVILDNIDINSKICFVCGSGNNGGDGYACADILNRMGFDVIVIYNNLPSTDDCKFFYNEYKDHNGIAHPFISSDKTAELMIDSNLIVDCLFGIGFHGLLNEIDSSIISLINDCDSLVISCDIPSGTIADNAECYNAVCADITVSFSSLKVANVSYPALEYNGKVILKDIGIPKEILDNFSEDDIIALADDNSIISPKRYINSHKGTYGTVAMYCGSDNMIGAAYFAASSALRCGVGLVKICSERSALIKLQQKLFEPVFCELSDHVVPADSYLIGCGIGKSMNDYIENILLNVKKPIVIDADGINYISTHINVLKNMTATKILTPHPAEMARLLGTTAEAVNSHRIEYAKKFSKEYNCILVLKGARTIIASPEKITINMSGSDSLAKGGSGDMLAGMISAYLAQGLSPYDAAVTGCFYHGKLGEMSTYQDLISEMIEKI